MLTKAAEGARAWSSPAAQIAYGWMRGCNDHQARRKERTGQFRIPPEEHHLFMFACDVLIGSMQSRFLLPPPSGA